MQVMTISLNLENDMIRVVIEGENWKRDMGIDFDDGISDCAENVLKDILGEMAMTHWQTYIEQLVDDHNIALSLTDTSLSPSQE